MAEEKKISKYQLGYLEKNYDLLDEKFRQSHAKENLGELSYAEAYKAMGGLLKTLKAGAKTADEKTTAQTVEATVSESVFDNMSEKEARENIIETMARTSILMGLSEIMAADRKKVMEAKDVKEAKPVETVSPRQIKRSLLKELDAIQTQAATELMEGTRLSEKEKDLFMSALKEGRFNDRQSVNPAQIRRLVNGGQKLEDVLKLSFEAAKAQIKGLGMTSRQAQGLGMSPKEGITSGEADKKLGENAGRAKYTPKTVYPHIQKALDSLGIDYPGKAEGKPCLYRDFVKIAKDMPMTEEHIKKIVKYSLQDELKQNAERFCGGKETAFAAAVAISEYEQKCIERSTAPLNNGTETDKNLYSYMIRLGYEKKDLDGMTWTDANEIRLQDAYAKKLLGYEAYKFFTSSAGAVEVGRNEELRGILDTVKLGREVITDPDERREIKSRFEDLSRELKADAQEKALHNDKIATTNRSLTDAVHQCACEYVQVNGTTSGLLQHLAKAVAEKRLYCFPKRDNKPALMSDLEISRAVKATGSRDEYTVYSRCAMNAIAEVVPEAIRQGRQGFKAVAEAVQNAQSTMMKKLEKSSRTAEHSAGKSAGNDDGPT